MLNNKGLIGQLIVFIVVLGIVVGFVFAVHRVGGQTAAETLFSDELSSFSLIGDAVVNTPSCLMLTEVKEVAGQTELIAKRGIIDWGKIDDENSAQAKSRCVLKGPYIWNAIVIDEGRVEKRTILNFALSDDEALASILKVAFLATSSPTSSLVSGIVGIITNVNSFGGNYPSCNLIGQRTIPVVIKRGDEFHKGSVLVQVASMDGTASIVRDRQAIGITITNTGTCATAYDYTIDIVDSETGASAGLSLYSPPFQNFNTPITAQTTTLQKGQENKLLYVLLNADLSNKTLKVDISPSGLSEYVKTYKKKL